VWGLVQHLYNTLIDRQEKNVKEIRRTLERRAHRSCADGRLFPPYGGRSPGLKADRSPVAKATCWVSRRFLAHIDDFGGLRRVGNTGGWPGVREQFLFLAAIGESRLTRSRI